MRRLPSPLLVVTDRWALNPPPSAGEGGPRSGSGEGSTGLSGEVAVPSPARHPPGTLPRRGGRDDALVTKVAAALHGGARWVWFRERDMEPRSRKELAFDVQDVVRAAGGHFTIGGDPDLAGEIGADGVHLSGGATEAEIARARQLLPDGLIGLSAHSLAEIEAVAGAGADYCTLSPIFATASKPGYGPALGVEAIRDAARYGLPVLALGGLSRETIPACRDAGAAGIAVMGGLMRADAPEAATAGLLSAWGQRPDGP